MKYFIVTKCTEHGLELENVHFDDLKKAFAYAKTLKCCHIYYDGELLYTKCELS